MYKDRLIGLKGVLSCSCSRKPLETDAVELFQDAKSGVYKKLWEKIQLNPQESLVSDTQEALDKGLNNQGTNKYAYTSGKLYMTELIRQHNACHMTVLKEEYLKGWPFDPICSLPCRQCALVSLLYIRFMYRP